MTNGSFGDHLLGSVQTCSLDWNARYNIGLGAAEGLCYLHYDCKLNNILLDEVLQAHVRDSGLVKLIDFPCSKSMSTVAGSNGYCSCFRIRKEETEYC